MQAAHQDSLAGAWPCVSVPPHHRNPAVSTFVLGERPFVIQSAVLDLTGRHATLDIQTEGQMVGAEVWAPYLYHHGLALPVNDPAALAGQTVVLAPSGHPDCPHPDAGYLYVQGHEELAAAELVLGAFDGQAFEARVHGLAAVDGQGELDGLVPFVCTCRMSVWMG